MAIGLVSREEFDREIKEKETEAEIKSIVRHGRTDGDVNIPESLRKIIGETSVIDGRDEALQIAKDFGVSSSSVSAYAKGATSTASYDSPNKSLISHINKSRRRAVKRASSVLNQALGAISQEKLDHTDAKDLASISKDMSAIIKNLEPSSVDSSESKGPTFVVFAPQIRKEESFDVIDVQE